MKICGGNAISDCGNGNDKEEEYANESKWWQHGQVFKPKMRGRGSPIPIFVLRSSLKFFFTTPLCITDLQRYPIFVLHRPKYLFNAVHHGTANVHLQNIRCGTMRLLPPNKDMSENGEYCVTIKTIETCELLEPNDGCKLVKEVILVRDIYVKALNTFLLNELINQTREIHRIWLEYHYPQFSRQSAH